VAPRATVPSQVTGRSRWHWQPEAGSCRRGSRRRRHAAAADSGSKATGRVRVTRESPGPPAADHTPGSAPAQATAATRAGSALGSESSASSHHQRARTRRLPTSRTPPHKAGRPALSLRLSLASTFKSSWGFEKRCSPPITRAPYAHHCLCCNCARTHVRQLRRPSLRLIQSA